MAESNSIVPEKLLCRFFAMSACRDGEYCLFSHDRSIAQLDNVCRYNLEGRCYFGPHCRYDHVKMKPNRHKFKKSVTSKSSRENTTQSKISSSSRLNTSSAKLNMTNLPRSDKKPVDPAILSWANAPEFIPKSKQMSYAEKLMVGQVPSNKSKQTVFCAYYFESGDCPLGDACDEIHGEICEMCGLACLSPFDLDQQKRHKDLCEKEFMENMEHSFAIQRSKDKTCGICFDTIMEKEQIDERRFGIMASCNHVFCLSCIRKWRQMKPDLQFLDNNVLDASVTRACPECRLPSDFIIPNSYWVDDEEEKKKLIETYKTNLSKKHCKYFRKGEGSCPFGGACFYLHQYPDGSKADLPPPTRRRRQNQDGDLDFVERIFLSDFFTNHDDPVLMNVRFSDLVYVLSDSDEDSDESFSFFFDEQL